MQAGEEYFPSQYVTNKPSLEDALRGDGEVAIEMNLEVSVVYFSIVTLLSLLWSVSTLVTLLQPLISLECRAFWQFVLSSLTLMVAVLGLVLTYNGNGYTRDVFYDARSGQSFSVTAVSPGPFGLRDSIDISVKDSSGQPMLRPGELDSRHISRAEVQVLYALFGQQTTICLVLFGLTSVAWWDTARWLPWNRTGYQLSSDPFPGNLTALGIAAVNLLGFVFFNQKLPPNRRYQCILKRSLSSITPLLFDHDTDQDEVPPRQSSSPGRISSPGRVPVPTLPEHTPPEHIPGQTSPQRSDSWSPAQIAHPGHRPPPPTGATELSHSTTPPSALEMVGLVRNETRNNDVVRTSGRESPVGRTSGRESPVGRAPSRQSLSRQSLPRQSGSDTGRSPRVTHLTTSRTSFGSIEDSHAVDPHTVLYGEPPPYARPEDLTAEHLTAEHLSDPPTGHILYEATSSGEDSGSRFRSGEGPDDLQPTFITRSLGINDYTPLRG
ncbi:putative transmembrane protein [Gregarina niphandrodes]|uniref:Transmembrane protein n=1 Tax=Gregarina niphandrodes TaxID=110365 RepID=A0A023B5V1_GRENI|nr:putative transmembrane protein [Gregarina niphandrodes]EZG63298.1 putative transmembrane protein [Gregarina niphandrodes]|eukprot:XP_011130690.1 putative transmembrane protein [Gregarina niphandrodes]